MDMNQRSRKYKLAAVTNATERSCKVLRELAIWRLDRVRRVRAGFPREWCLKI